MQQSPFAVSASWIIDIRRAAVPIPLWCSTLGTLPKAWHEGTFASAGRAEVAVPIIINTLKKDRLSDPMHFQAGMWRSRNIHRVGSCERRW